MRQSLPLLQIDKSKITTNKYSPPAFAQNSLHASVNYRGCGSVTDASLTGHGIDMPVD